MRYISLLDASERSGIPYISIYRHMIKAEKRGVIEFERYGFYRKAPLSVRYEDFTRYLEQRIARQNSGDLERKRKQSKNALASLQAVRAVNKKVASNDNVQG
jgi:hypothetical protein